MKNLCIVDTCCVRNLANVDSPLGNKPLFKWLQDEFKIFYCQVVFKEIKNQRANIPVKRIKFEDHIWRRPISEYERRLFGTTLTRPFPKGVCPTCRQPIMGTQNFTPDLTDEKDRGERHNCCVAIDAVANSKYPHAIFLTDDIRANRDYVTQVFEAFPIGVIWSSLDLILYLFTKYRRRIPFEHAAAALRDINAQGITIDVSKSASRLTKYNKKLYYINKVLL